ncbi:TetR/AcrR family transcriptional regulator [Loigolactobacillus zhaoyuanensis]|uniref:TetR/AcrR family transcriptional regulator n=1 Tax=Loigolactobacillus zhaoyuanensis TaxID=2486017 RepID=A0ABW8UHX8_9LACO|nr:TetR/AcrR family transcriptional regulator C-terminal domain-containing protein [Loigolactobacillus zhaoyuanensis]
MAHRKLDREQIIEQALKTLGKSNSFSDFSLRKVATDLQVDVSTLYWHFKNKQEILQAMAEAIIAQVKLPNQQLEWTVQLKQLFSNIFDIYEQYPLAAILMVETIPSSLVRLQLIDRTIAIMTNAGVDEQTAHIAATSIDFLLTGLVIDLMIENRFRQQITTQQDQNLAGHVKKIRELAQTHHLEHMQASIKMRNQFSAKQQFEKGLDLIIDGLKQHTH